jgi:hypothetical protein
MSDEGELYWRGEPLLQRDRCIGEVCSSAISWG